MCVSNWCRRGGTGAADAAAADAAAADAVADADADADVVGSARNKGSASLLTARLLDGAVNAADSAAFTVAAPELAAPVRSVGSMDITGCITGIKFFEHARNGERRSKKRARIF